MLRYPLDEARLAEIQRQLAARDAVEGDAKPAAEPEPHVLPDQVPAPGAAQ
jgi:Na+/melibiose symporter-like transporter